MEPAIAVKQLRKYYRVQHKEPGLVGTIKDLVGRKYEEVRAVDGVSFEINSGELVGFIGPNGAGKTTTLKCLAGLLYPTSGWVSVEGFEPARRQAALQKQFSLVMGQKNQLWWDLPPVETFRLNQAIYEIPEAEFNTSLGQLVTLLDIEKILKIQVRKLSLGERMKCELAAALLHRPKVLFLDEPTIGLDVVMQKSLRDFIKDYNQNFSATILLTSHYMEDVKELCRRIIVIDRGRILFDGQLKDVIDRYASNKILKLTFSRDLDQRQLAETANVTDYNFPQATVTVPRQEAVQTATRILKDFPVADLTIEEPPIETVIRKFLSSSKPA